MPNLIPFRVILSFPWSQFFHLDLGMAMYLCDGYRVPLNTWFYLLIIYMKKFLHCDWLREMQFLGNTVQKKGNLVQKRVTNVTFWLANKQRNSLRANQMRHLNGAKFGSAPDQFRAKTAMVGVCSTFAFATETTVEELKNCSKNENTAKSTGFWLSVGKN